MLEQARGMYQPTAQIVSLRDVEKQVGFGQVAKLAKNAGTLPQNALATKDYAK
ncbi:hypothetical protein J2Z48_000560 [Croceifilum oryzae]|uniref:Uncharacterized protein n=1 Tax=Croceifilum oryzae TaxID=1553429 RepID=A0AAJ1WSX2_9BACL|nr:hypothetical protein [Croceifilum oryzae]MDQ0416396.1 hypothetical protein [Croceifilum oryzae]